MEFGMTKPALTSAAQSVGKRSSQQDSFAIVEGVDDEGQTLLLVADGLGGHTGGALASGIVADSMVAAYREAIGMPTDRLRGALAAASTAVADAIKGKPEVADMASTVVAASISVLGVDWISVGDSSLLLVSNRQITRLNADHSMRSVFAYMVAAGKMKPEAAASDKRRNSLRSAIRDAHIELTDVSSRPIPLQAGDILILASDGLESLTHPQIMDLSYRAAPMGPAAVANALIQAVAKKDEPSQDNTTVAVFIPDRAYGGVSVDAEAVTRDVGAHGAAFQDQAAKGEPPPLPRLSIDDTVTKPARTPIPAVPAAPKPERTTEVRTRRDGVAPGGNHDRDPGVEPSAWSFFQRPLLTAAAGALGLAVLGGLWWLLKSPAAPVVQQSALKAGDQQAPPQTQATPKQQAVRIPLVAPAPQPAPTRQTAVPDEGRPPAAAAHVLRAAVLLPACSDMPGSARVDRLNQLLTRVKSSLQTFTEVDILDTQREIGCTSPVSFRLQIGTKITTGEVDGVRALFNDRNVRLDKDVKPISGAEFTGYDLVFDIVNLQPARPASDEPAQNGQRRQQGAARP
jgi:PPM family protein phosphatase